MKKILVIRFSSIGDIVLTTPVVRCLHEQIGAEVHYLTKESFRPLVDPNPHIRKVFSIRKRVGEVLPQLRAERYDFIVDLHHNLRSLQVKLGLWGVKSASFDKLNLEKWLMVRLKYDRLPDIHIVDRYLAAVKHLGVTNDGQGLDYFIPREEEVDVTQWLMPAGKTSGRGAAPPYVAFVVGAAHATKKLPEEKIIAICRGIPLPVMLLGGPAEAAEGARIAAGAGAHVVNTCGVLRLHQSASVVRQARWVISHDTGLMHIAAAFHRPLLSVWGNTIPAFGMYPYYPAGMDKNVSLEVEGLDCRPCSKIGFEACPKGHFRCMLDIPEQRFLAILTGGAHDPDPE